MSSAPSSPARPAAAAPALTAEPPSADSEPAAAQQHPPAQPPAAIGPFPRTEYRYLPPYADPLMRPTARVLWAARDASADWAHVFEQQDWEAVDEVLVRLVVFDKAYEITPDLTIPDADACTQWEHCGHLKPAHWVAETNEHASQAFLCAARALRDAGHLNRMPRRSCVLAFSRVALDLCAQPLVDARPGRSKLLGPAPPAGTIPRATPGIKGDLIGRLLARFDPIVRHAEQLAEPLEGHTAVFVYNKRRGAYIYDEQATCAANETEATDADVPDLASDGSSGSSDEPDHRPPSRQRAGIQGDGHGADEPAAADADEGVAVPVPASARRARSTCPATPPIVASVDVECVSSEGRPSLDDEQEERPPK